MRQLISIVLVLVALAGCGGDDHDTATAGPTGATTTTVATKQALLNLVVYVEPPSEFGVIRDGSDELDPCWPADILDPPPPVDGFADGAEVLVRDENDEIIGVGTLSPGVVRNLEPSGTSDTMNFECTWDATIDDLPTDAAFYRFSVGGGEPITVSRAELEDEGWRFAVSYGV
jgi:hypothetical protein